MTDLPPFDPPYDPEPVFEQPAAPKGDPKSRIIDALLELAAEREWDEISISVIARRADVSLSSFRDAFPSKGAVLAGLSRKIDKIVLDGTSDDLVGEPPKERLFDVLMRRLDALTPYKAGVAAVMAWARRNPVSATALNRSAVNSMRFMLEAAGIGSEGAAGAVKLQGLVIAWTRILDVWISDTEPGLARTMAALDKELKRGASIVARVEDVDRLTSPLRSMAQTFLSRAHTRARRGRRSESPDETDDAEAAV